MEKIIFSRRTERYFQNDIRKVGDENGFKELTPEELRRICDPDSLGFETTEELAVVLTR